MTTKSKKPKVVKGSHLTVTTYPDGKTVLVWDDAALLTEVRAAIAKSEHKSIDLTKMSKKDLEVYGRTMGIELDRRKSKEDLVKQLQAKSL